MSDYFSKNELLELGFRRVGSNCLISNQIKITDPLRMSIGDRVRIDSFCIFTLGSSGYIQLGSNIHIADKVRVVAGGGFVMEDETNIGIGSTILTVSDDYSGETSLGPMSSNANKDLTVSKILMRKFSVIATHSVVLPGVEFGEGSVLGAMSLAHKSLSPWTMYFGIPAVPIKPRSQNFKNQKVIK